MTVPKGTYAHRANFPPSRLITELHKYSELLNTFSTNNLKNIFVDDILVYEHLLNFADKYLPELKDNIKFKKDYSNTYKLKKIGNKIFKEITKELNNHIKKCI